MAKARYRNRQDANQKEIVQALKKIGCQVVVIEEPVDLLVGYRAMNFLLEVKALNTHYKGTPKQREFIQNWPGQVRIVRTPEEAISLVREAYV